MVCHSVCLVSDFFYPNIGGVEKHILQLAICLQKRGHKVCIVTHSYGVEFKGVQVLPKGRDDGIRVHYMDRIVVAEQVCLPTIVPFFWKFRRVLIEEGISIVHAHQSSSTLSHECISIADSLGCKTVLTEHSLYDSIGYFSFDNMVNKFLRVTLCHVNQVICVSDKCQENLIERTKLIAPPAVTTIPNAINAWEFLPDHTKRSPGYPSINVVLMSRLVPRKGVDLAVKVLPALCAKYPQVQIIIGGDGQRYGQIEQMRREHQLENRVALLGAVPAEDVRDVLVKGHIFLNCSLTESFCISLMEAASCGLKVVSTNVGGVPEVLPSDMIELCEPTAEDVLCGLSKAVDATIAEEEQEVRDKGSGPEEGASRAMVERERRQHERVKNLRSWMDVAEQTENVYSVLCPSQSPTQCSASDNRHLSPTTYKASFSWGSLKSKLARYSHLGLPEYLIAVGLAVFLEVASVFSSRA